MKDMQQNTTLDNELELPELDLHGEPVHPAWGMFKEFVNECDQEKYKKARVITCLLYTSPSPRDATLSRIPASA